MPPRGSPSPSISPWILGFRGESLPGPLADAIREGAISGLILFRDNLGGSLEAARALRREILDLVPAGRPFVLAADEEGGLISQTTGLRIGPRGTSRPASAARVSRWPAVPTPRALGRIGDPAACRFVGALLGERLRVLGVRLDFAPSLDLDAETANPVIGSRSFGPDPRRVARLARAFVSGLVSAGVAGCYKHFPGHGGTRLDSHLTLPSMDPAVRRLHERPFRLALEDPHPPGGLPARRRGLSPWVMSAHVDWGDGEPASLSRHELSVLRRWSPDTLRVTDALDMGAVSLKAGAGNRALLAGNDLLLVGRDWTAGLAAMARLARAEVRDPAIRRALHRSRRRIGPILDRLSSVGPGSLSVGSAEGLGAACEVKRRATRAAHGGADSEAERAAAERERLAGLHRAAVRLDGPPTALPRGDWTWVVPEELAPYADLRGWNPPRGRRRRCLEVVRIGHLDASDAAALARRLRDEGRPVLLATLFRGLPGPKIRRAWRSLLDLPNLVVLAHLLDEGWPGAAGPADRPEIVTALTSGPSGESLTGLAEVLDLPAEAWCKERDGLYFAVDT